MVPAAGAALSLWIWHRFGLACAFFAALIFVAFIPGYWTSSKSAHHVLIAVVCAAGLIALAFLDDRDRIPEALLWFGLYLAINLKIGALDTTAHWWLNTSGDTAFSKPFYWTTWALTWLIPPVILARGLRQKARFVMTAGWIAAIVTLVTNKPYLGLQRNTWDPMLLGALLTGAALFIRRWLAQGTGGIRHGFTARRLSGKDKSWMSAGTTALGLASPHTVTPGPEHQGNPVRFGGGDSAGGGASSEF
jgi:hypothetical protein